MNDQKRLSEKRRRVCYLNMNIKIFDAHSDFLERRLKGIGKVEIKKILSFDSPDLNPCDLMIINGININQDSFLIWFKSLFKNKQLIQSGIPVPIVIVVRLNYDYLLDIWNEIYNENWYFDLIHPDHLGSLPVRVANLLRMHDHLHEIKRYNDLVNRLASDVSSMRQEIKKGS